MALNMEFKKQVDNLIPTPEFRNQAAYAAHKGVVRQTVTDWKARGFVVFSRKRVVDFRATDVRLTDHGIRQRSDANLTETPRRLADLPVTDGMWSKADAETVKENYAARLK